MVRNGLIAVPASRGSVDQFQFWPNPDNGLWIPDISSMQAYSRGYVEAMTALNGE